RRRRRTDGALHGGVAAEQPRPVHPLLVVPRRLPDARAAGGAARSGATPGRPDGPPVRAGSLHRVRAVLVPLPFPVAPPASDPRAQGAGPGPVRAGRTGGDAMIPPATTPAVAAGPAETVAAPALPPVPTPVLLEAHPGLTHGGIESSYYYALHTLG